MKTNNLLIRKASGILAVFLLVFAFSMEAYSQCSYCSPTMSTSSVDEHISRVVINTIDKKTTAGEWKGTVQDYTSTSTTLKAGSTYTVKVEVGPNDYGSSDQVVLSIDFNHNCSWDSGETFSITWQSSSGGVGYHQADITIPTSAMSGNTRMRVSMVYGTAGPCTNATWGENEDYTANIVLPAPDAGVDLIIPPTAPYNEGTYPVKMQLGSYGDADLASCTINWSVNGVAQTPYNWSGTLKKGNNVQVTLGNYAFNYPDGGPYNPFVIRVWLTNIVGVGTSNPDVDPSNNDKNINTSPSTEDAQPVAVTQPSGAFVPGSVPIYVMIKNNARKPLTTVDIEWWVDGVKQTTKKWFGSLTQNQTAEVNIGSYNFTFKTPLAPFYILVHTANPNGVNDPIPSNDSTNRSLAPSLVAGTYIIGGTGAHFPTLSNAINYLNASGIMGDGDVYMRINSGTYNEQVMLNNFPHGVSNFYFESVSGYASDVNINFAPTTSKNYIFGINGVNNVYFRNLTFNVTDGGAGTALMLSNINNISFNNVVINGVSSPANNIYSLVSMTDVTNAIFTNNSFYKGYNAIYASYNGTLPSLKLSKNLFQDYANWAVSQNGSPIIPQINNKTGNNEIQVSTPIDIQDNVFTGSSVYPQGGVYLNASATVKNNKFTNFASTNSGMSAIAIAAPGATASSLVETNTISNLTGISGVSIQSNNVTINKNAITTSANTSVGVNGLSLSGTNITVSYNKINVSGNSVKAGNGIYANAAAGTIADNLVTASFGSAFSSDNAISLGTYYNTFVTSANSYPAAKFNLGMNFFMKNIVYNAGTGNSVINNSSNIQSGNNIFFTKGTTNGTDLTNYKNSTGDNTSSNVSIALTDDGTYQYSLFQPEALTYLPVGLPGTLEKYDYNGNERAGFYYAGYAGIILEFSIIQQPQPLLACVGEQGKALYVAASISYGAEAQYQWQREGVDIPGATKPVYKFGTFNYETTGNYRCKVYGPANTINGMYTNEVLVYTLRPTEIIKQPTNQEAMLGGTAFFTVEVHIKGIVAPYFQHKYQWWRHYNGEDVQLMDNEYYANTTSPTMTITNLKEMHFSKDEFDYYYCVIEGQCGIVTSDNVQLKMAAGEITFNVQPTDQKVCLGSNLVLSAAASIVGSSETLDYQWYFNDQPLNDDVRINGSKTSNLTISGLMPSDEGSYYCQATSTTYSKVKNSSNALVTILTAPSIDVQPTDQNLKEGENLILSLTASGIEPITYQWFKDDILIPGATNSTFTVEGVTLDNNGFYFCDVTNDCGTTKSTAVQVIVTKDGGVQGVADDNPIKLNVTPNPAISEIKINFTLEKDSQVEIALLDMTGKKVATKLSEAQNGDNTILMTLGNNIASGTYFVQVKYNGISVTRQIVVKK